MYLTYEEYKEMGGVLDKAAFSEYVLEAELKISAETYKRIYNVDDETKDIVKACMARVIDAVKEGSEAATKARVASFNHDGLSQSFASPTPADYSARISGVISDFLSEQADLSGIPLLYRGCGV